jgi:hypothetical protein
MDTATEPHVIAVWAREDEFEPEAARIFTGDQYADWAETNHLAGTFPDPTAFYGITPDGTLTKLRHGCDVGPYGEDDYATVTHTWTHPGDQPATYATGCARRDGRA